MAQPNVTSHLQDAMDGNTDLVSWVFANQGYDQHRKIYIDTEDPTRSLSAAKARTTVTKLIAGFKAVGLKKGDCVCVHAFNDIMYPMFFLAIAGAGGVFTGSNPAYTASELNRHLHMTKSRFLLSEPGLLSKIGTAVEVNALPASRIFSFDKTAKQSSLHYHSWQELLKHGEADWLTFSTPGEAKNTTVALLSTSGTSGLPKAAMISQHSMVMQNVMLDDLKQKPYEVSDRVALVSNFEAYVHLSDDHQVSRLIALPVFHAFAFPIAHVSPLRDGTPTYMMRRMDLPRYMDIIQQYKITETAMVPPVIISILKSSMKAYKLLRSLRTVWCAGAPLAQTTGNQMYRLLRPTARLLQVWGMTESGWITTFLWPEKDHSGSVGRLLPGMEAKLLYKGEVVGEDNMQAEIYVRGPLVMQAYLDNPEATRATKDKDGWLRTGDVAYRDQGKFYIVDREKELIKVRGWQVSPAELESQLLLHPTICDAAVIGVPSNPYSDEETELPRAYVVTAPKEYLSEAAVKAYMSTHLAKYKSLDGGVKFIDAIPKNSTGKIMRKDLRERAAAETRADTRALTISIVPPPLPSPPPPPPLPPPPSSDAPVEQIPPLSTLSLASTISDSDRVNSSDASQLATSDTDCSVHNDGCCCVDPQQPEMKSAESKHKEVEPSGVAATVSVHIDPGPLPITSYTKAATESQETIVVACDKTAIAPPLHDCEPPSTASLPLA